MSETDNPKNKAYTDVVSFWQGKTSKEEFIASYKANAGKHLSYAQMVEELMLSGIETRHFEDTFLKECGISLKECSDQQNKPGTTRKLVDALFDIAYTRTPNNERGGDGKPMSYDRKYNIGIIAERALLSLSHIKKDQEKQYLRTAWAYPRSGADYKVSDEMILESVRVDQQSCFRANQERIAKFCTKINS